MSDTDLCFATLAQTGERLRKRELSPVEVTRAQLARIEALNPKLHAYLTVLAESALREAADAEREIAAGRWRGPLHGVPIGVKDLCDVAGVVTSCASRVLEAKPAASDSTVVKKLRAAGAVIAGKLNQTEFALSGYNPALPVPQNPWDPGRFPGASSSGSGVAASAGLAFGTLGSDTGGSIRFPAACCGVVGLKPTRGRVSRSGVFPLGGSLDHIGPLTRSVTDAAIVFDAIAGPDPADPTTLRDAPANALAGVEGGALGVRIGVDFAYASEGVDPAVAEAFHRDVSRLESLGANLIQINVPAVDEVQRFWSVLCAAEAVVHHRGLWPERAASYGPTFRTFLEYGARVTSADVAEAWLVREDWNARFALATEGIDVLACPSMISLPFPLALLSPHAEFTPGLGDLLRFTAPFDFNGFPTLSIPSGFSDGLPESLQLVAKPCAESLLCRVGRAFETTTDVAGHRPPHAP